MLPTTSCQRRTLAFALAAALLIGRLAGLSFGAESAGTAVTFLPHWIPQAQFAGFYVAADQGFYREAGLDVEILQGGPERPPSQLLPAGDVDFATMFLSNGILLRGEGKPVVNLAQLLHESSLLLVTHADSGIETPQDLAGKKVAIWPEFEAQPLALFRQFEIEPSVIQQGASMRVFQRRGVDAACAMRYNEFQWLYLSGFNEEDLNVIALEAYGVGFPEDGIYALEETVNQNPETAAAFVEATLAGWRHAFAHPDDAIDSVMTRIEQAGLLSNRSHQRRMLEALRTVYLDEKGELRTPRLRQEDFTRVADMLMDAGDLPQRLNYETFHRLEALDR